MVTRRRAEDMGQYSLFGEEEPAAEGVWRRHPGHGVGQGHQARHSRRRCSVSTCPTIRCSASQATLRSLVTTSIPGLREQPDRASVSVGGIVGAITRRYTRKGDPMLFFQLEDLEGSTEVVCVPRTCRRARPPGAPRRGAGGDGAGRPAGRLGQDGGPVHHRADPGDGDGGATAGARSADVASRWWGGCGRCWPIIPGRSRCSSTWSGTRRHGRAAGRRIPGRTPDRALRRTPRVAGFDGCPVLKLAWAGSDLA